MGTKSNWVKTNEYGDYRNTPDRVAKNKLRRRHLSIIKQAQAIAAVGNTAGSSKISKLLSLIKQANRRAVKK